MTRRKAEEKRQRGAQAYRGGLVTEYAAMAFLFLTGHAILGHRCATPFGEVDILARRGDTLLIVEVKKRGNFFAAAAAIAPAQRDRLLRAAAHLAGQLAKRKREGQPTHIRIDAMLFAPPLFWPRHIKGINQ